MSESNVEIRYILNLKKKGKVQHKPRNICDVYGLNAVFIKLQFGNFNVKDVAFFDRADKFKA